MGMVPEMRDERSGIKDRAASRVYSPPMNHRTLVSALVLLLLGAPTALAAQPAATQPAAASLTDAQMEQFLLTGKVGRARELDKGVTASTRATLTDGTLTHDAHIQSIDQSKQEFKGGPVPEFDFRDKWQFNVAAYKIDRLLGLDLVPVTVERRWRTEAASFSWWVDDGLMDEGERQNKKLTPPNQACWNDQMLLIRLFDQLIDNIDRNAGNIVITRTWRLWAIDHTRAFRRSKTPPKLETLTRIDRRLLERLTMLDFATLKRELKAYIVDGDVRALLARRDAIVAHFRARGEAALYDRPDAAAGCVAAAALLN